MKKVFLTLFLAFAGLTAAHAELKVLTVDMGVIYNDYYRVQRANKKFEALFETANKDIREMMEEGMKIVDSLRDLESKINNPAITDEAREKYLDEARGLAEQIQQKEMEVNQFRQETEQKLAQRRQTIIEYYVGKINEVVAQIAKDKGADFVLNTTGPDVVYAKTSFDVTQEVLTVLNKDQGKASDDDEMMK